jgi:hypothetical protein
MKQTAVEWLIEHIKIDHNYNALTGRAWVKIFEQAKQIEREQMATNCNQLEISDEDIFKQSIKEMEEWYGSGCKEEIDSHFRGAKWMKKWYREQLKQK